MVDHARALVDDRRQRAEREPAAAAEGGDERRRPAVELADVAHPAGDREEDAEGVEQEALGFRRSRDEPAAKAADEELERVRLAIAVGGNFMLGALMTLGIGLYAPCMILVSLLGMNPRAAFPIMMGSCAFLMPVGSLRFIRERKYHLRAALGLALGGIPGVLVAAFIVRELPLGAIRWLVIVVVVYTAVMMLRYEGSYYREFVRATIVPAIVILALGTAYVVFSKQLAFLVW